MSVRPTCKLASRRSEEEPKSDEKRNRGVRGSGVQYEEAKQHTR
jgi:hypothetical protein